MSEEWNNMKDEDKKKYAKIAEADKARYEVEKKNYEKTLQAATPVTAAKPVVTKPKGKSK